MTLMESSFKPKVHMIVVIAFVSLIVILYEVGPLERFGIVYGKQENGRRYEFAQRNVQGNTTLVPYSSSTSKTSTSEKSRTAKSSTTSTAASTISSTSTTSTTTSTTTTATTLSTTKSPTITPKARPKILMWAKQYHRVDWKFPELPNGDGGCDISYRREDLEGSDAVVFFMKSCKSSDRPNPSTRRKDQVYVWWSHESPWTVRNYYRHMLTEFNNYFNWTMTFRTDSDVLAAMWPTPALDYFLMRLGRNDEMVDKNLAEKPTISEEDFQEQFKALMQHKQKLVAWIVSDCSITKGARERLTLVDKLEKEGKLHVERYGKCVQRPLPFAFPKLFEVLSEYKFYLAFENSFHCKDYLTEKTIFNSLVGGAVPIVHGPTREDTAKILPKGSYIFLEDFENMAKLGELLNSLDKNDAAYMEYFKWWKDPGAQTYPRYGLNYGASYLPRNSKYPEVSNTDLQDDWLEYERFGMYHLCRKLKRGDNIYKTKIIPSLADEWYGKEKEKCYER